MGLTTTDTLDRHARADRVRKRLSRYLSRATDAEVAAARVRSTLPEIVQEGREAGLTMDEIASRSGTSAMTCYRALDEYREAHGEATEPSRPPEATGPPEPKADRPSSGMGSGRPAI